MCEIAVLQPGNYTNVELKTIARTLYESMRSSLGVVAVYTTDDDLNFEYEIYKSVEPDPEELSEFVEANSDALRHIIHGRLATTGAVTKEHAHPLTVDCEMCNVDYVIHNGIISRYREMKEEHEDEGHTYSTGVDSEVIAHDYGIVPNDFDVHADGFYQHEPAFILLNDERIYIHGNRYHLTKDGRMALSYRDFGPDRMEDDHHTIIFYPSEEAREGME